MAKVNLVHVPYKGGGPAMQGFLGGQVDSFFATPISSISQIRAGKAIAARDKVGLRALNDVLRAAFDAPGQAGFARGGGAITQPPVEERQPRETAPPLAAAHSRSAFRYKALSVAFAGTKPGV